ncbi:MAG: MarR family winged helix-turn-helix transcriptional regulator [Niabella sp.]
MESFLKDLYKREDLTLQQYNILRILRGSKPQPLSTMQIRERMMDKMSDTSRIVDRLLLKKLVTKKVSADDQRLVEVRITEKGITLLKKLDNVEDEIAKFLGNLSDKEAGKISDLLDKIHTE